METHGGQPLNGIKGFQVLPVFGRVHDLGFKREVGHSLLGEGRPVDGSRDILHGLLVTGSNPGTAVDIEAGPIAPETEPVTTPASEAALLPGAGQLLAPR